MEETSDQIRVAVRGQDGIEMLFRIGPNVKLIALLKVYCERKGFDLAAVQFFFNDKRINRSHTPAKLGMKSDDKIDAMLHMSGGCYSVLPKKRVKN